MSERSTERRGGEGAYLKGLARGLAGAVLFAFALFMTMEMWWIGFYIDPLRLLLFLVVTFVMLVPLSRLVGFEQTRSFADDVTDAIVAFGIGIVASAVILATFALLGPGMGPTNWSARSRCRRHPRRWVRWSRAGSWAKTASNANARNSARAIPTSCS